MKNKYILLYYYIPEDHGCWDNLKPPKSPNEYEISIFKKYIKGNVLLLGETKALRPLANEGIDLYPTDFAKEGHWFDIKEYYDTIIGDGCINLSGFSLIEAVKNNCDRFICRIFGKELKESQRWKYVKCFFDEFDGATEIIKTQSGCYIVIWDFKKNNIYKK